MIIKWLKMKRLELELKTKLYTYTSAFLSEQENLISRLGEVYLVLKDTPIEELQDKVISLMAEKAHEKTKKKIKNVNFKFRLEQNKKQKKYCLKYKDYLTQRVLMMKEKKACSLILYFLKGKYKGFGRVKTFLGDLVNIIK